MAKISKRLQEAQKLFDSEKKYSLEEAVKLVKETTKVKFDATVDVAFKMNLDPTKADQQIRGAIVLPNGTGKKSKILVLGDGDAIKEVEGMDGVEIGNEDTIARIKNDNYLDFDVIVATPQFMPKIGKIGQILGPKGLMPNPKTGTVTPDVKKAVDEINAGKVTYRLDKLANVHVIVGKVSFDASKLKENLLSLYRELMRIKPAAAKGNYIENMSVSSTMGPGIKVDFKTLID